MLRLVENLQKMRKRLSASEVIAGLTLAAIGIPEVMGYTKIIGTPIETGLYSMFLPSLAFAFFGSSRHLVVGADSATAAIVASALVATAIPYSPEYLAIASAIAFIAGLMLLLARVLRLGFLSNFLSQTVLVGFLSGVGVQVMLSQIPAMLKITSPIGRNLSQFHSFSSVISVSIVLLLTLGEKWRPRFPSQLILLCLIMFFSAVFDFEKLGVQMVGAVPSGFPHFTLPNFSSLPLLTIVSISFSCCIVILAQSAATGSAYAFLRQDRFDEDQDLIGLGFANLAAAMSGTFVVNGSPTRTAIVDSAGGRTQLAQVIAALITLLVLLFFTHPLSYLPNPALAAVVFGIGMRLFDSKGLRNIFRQSPMEFYLAALTGLTVVFVGVKEGILLALILSLLYHVRRSYKPNTDVLVKDSEGRWMPQAEHKDIHAIPGVLVFWFGADLFYANVTRFISEIHRLTKTNMEQNKETLRLFVIDAGAITGIDYSAAKHVQYLQTEMKNKNIRLVWVHVSQGLKRDMRRHCIYEEDSLFETLHQCLSYFKIS